MSKSSNRQCTWKVSLSKTTASERARVDEYDYEGKGGIAPPRKVHGISSEEYFLMAPVNENVDLNSLEMRLPFSTEEVHEIREANAELQEYGDIRILEQQDFESYEPSKEDLKPAFEFIEEPVDIHPLEMSVMKVKSTYPSNEKPRDINPKSNLHHHSTRHRATYRNLAQSREREKSFIFASAISNPSEESDDFYE